MLELDSRGQRKYSSESIRIFETPAPLLATTCTSVASFLNGFPRIVKRSVRGKWLRGVFLWRYTNQRHTARGGTIQANGRSKFIVRQAPFSWSNSLEWHI